MGSSCSRSSGGIFSGFFRLCVHLDDGDGGEVAGETQLERAVGDGKGGARWAAEGKVGGGGARGCGDERMGRLSGV